jgi:integrase
MPRDSTRKPRRRKAADRPKKPYPDFPLSPHPSGKWQKKIRGKIHYFGRWAKRVEGKLVRVEGDGWKEALELYKADADDLHAGRTPRVKGGELTVADLCNRFLTAKLRQWEAGEISSRMFEPTADPKKPKGEYPATTNRIISTFGATRLVDDLAAEDFEALRDGMAKQFGPVRLGNEIQKVRTVFKYGYESGLIEKPVRYGPQFKKPSASVLRRHRAKNGERMLEADELRRLIKAADVQLKAMFLLGVNAGLGNHDIATLPLSALDLDTAWVNYPRPKTGIPRRCPLWPETVEALRAAIAARPESRQEEAAGLVFMTTRGRPWLSRGIANPVSFAARDLMKTVGIHHEGIGFYTLRHVFRTVADAARDPVAIDLIMGHSDPSMGGHYRERIDDGRLKAVAEHVRRWLFPQGESASHNADAGG